MKNRFLKYFVIVYSLFLLQSCSLTNEPQERKNYSVLFNLTSNAEHQKLYIYRTLDDNEIISTGIFRGFAPFYYSNAQIGIKTDNLNFSNFIFYKDTTKIRAPWDTTRVVWSIAKIEYYYKNITSFEIIPQNQYTLTIDIDDLTITGSTIVPDNFQLLNPTENQTFNYNNKGIVEIPIEWTQSIGSYGYIVNVIYTNNSDVIFSNTLTYTTYTFIQDYEWTSYRTGQIKIEVLAFDKNYFDHVLRKKPSAGIEGAYGYFGSSILKSVTVNIEK